MNPANFLFQVVAPHLEFSNEDLDNLGDKFNVWWESLDAQNRVKKIFSNPFVVVLMGLALPFVVSFVSRKLQQWIGDQDNDGEVDVADALLALAERVSKQKVDTKSGV